jgi:hypothetical protein
VEKGDLPTDTAQPSFSGTGRVASVIPQSEDAPPEAPVGRDIHPESVFSSPIFQAPAMRPSLPLSTERSDIRPYSSQKLASLDSGSGSPPAYRGKILGVSDHH